MNEMQTLLSDTVTRLFTDRVTTDLRESAEKGQWPAKLWQDVEEGGLTLTPIPDATWGTHLADGSIALGTLVDLVRRQIGIWGERQQ